MDIREIRISGGIVRNPFWLQILADVLNWPLQVPKATDLGTLCAALSAAVGIKFYSDYEQAAGQMVTIDRDIAPDPTIRQLYAEGYVLYKECYQSTLGLYRQLSEYSAKHMA